MRNRRPRANHSTLNLRERLKDITVLRFLASVKLSVVCLFLLFVLTFWGTVSQVENGLYIAQERFFNSFYFIVLGFLPFPGAQLVMIVLFLNLVCAAIVHLKYTRSQSGLLIVHFALILFLLSAFITYYGIAETHMNLLENEGANVSESYRDWELSVWQDKDGQREVLAYDVNRAGPGQVFSFEQNGFDVEVETYFKNCRAFRAQEGDVPYQNSSGIGSIQWAPPEKEPENNLPGGTFKILAPGVPARPLLLYGGELGPTKVKINAQEYHLMLRRKRLPLPFVLTLLDFRKEVYPGTDTAKSYESEVEITSPAMTRKTVIFMNNPLRYQDLTFYQASYSIDERGRERSTLAVVRNSGRLLPYIASILTFLGLLVHFGRMLVLAILRRTK